MRVSMHIRIALAGAIVISSAAKGDWIGADVIIGTNPKTGSVRSTAQGAVYTEQNEINWTALFQGYHNIHELGLPTQILVELFDLDPSARL